MLKVTICVSALCLSAFNAYAEDVTAAQMLRKGTVLTDADVNIKISPSEDFTEIRSAFVGQELRRTIYAGHKINRAHVGAPILVKRNAPVTMIYNYGTMRLTAKGRALGAGSIGDTINVMNTSSRKKIIGIVTGPETVEVSQ